MTTLNINSPLSPSSFQNVTTPLANINPSLVNVDSSSYSGGFGSTETSRQFSLNPTPMSGIQSASASALQMGGRRKKHHKTIKLRIKKIASKYKKMKGGKRLTLKSAKKQLLSVINLIKADNSKTKSKKRRKTRKSSRKYKKGGFPLGRAGGSRRHYQKGGTYHQYMGGVPNTPVYQTGSINLSPSESALANPVPFSVLPNCTNCVDNYNHFTNSGKQVW